MNRIILLGRLTKDVEVRYTPNGKVVAGSTIAVDRPYTSEGGEKQTDFIPVIIWGKQAEAFGNYVHKGQRVLLEGRLQIRSYDGKDGTKKYVAEVIADRFEFIEKKNYTEAGQNDSRPQGMSAMGSVVPMDEEIPF